MIDNLQYIALIVTIIINLLVYSYQRELGKTASYIFMGLVVMINLIYILFSVYIAWKIGFSELVEIFPRALIVFKKINDKKKLEDKIEMQRIELKLIQNRNLLKEMGYNPEQELELNY